MKIKIIISVLVIGIFFLGGKMMFLNQKGDVSKTQPAKPISFQNITSPKLAKMLEKKDFFFINVHIPYEGELAKTDAFIPYNEIKKNIDKLPQDKNAKIVLYCRSGRMSEIASQTLTKLGYTNVYNHIGGMLDWKKEGYGVIKK